jgi:hypothetical protein
METGRLAAQLEAARAAHSPGASNLTAAPPEWMSDTSEPAWRRMGALWPLLVAVLLVLMMIVVPR